MSIEFEVQTGHGVKRQIEDKDFRNFAKRLAYAWAQSYANGNTFPPRFELEDLMASARIWGIVNAELGYDIFQWFQKAEFVGNVPSDVKEKYNERYVVNQAYIDSLPTNIAKKYSYEQYFIYREMCKVFGVDPNIDDDLQSF